MGQTKLESIIEQCLNLGSGFLISLLVMQLIITPLFGLNVSVADNLGITCIFTVVSFFRGYAWRRLFNWYRVTYLS